MKQLEITKVPKLTFEVKEALNQICMNLGFFGKNIKKIMITSSLPGRGMSFISFQLWQMLAELNASVLLIDYLNSYPGLQKQAEVKVKELAGDNASTKNLRIHSIFDVWANEVARRIIIELGYVNVTVSLPGILFPANTLLFIFKITAVVLKSFPVPGRMESSHLH